VNAELSELPNYKNPSIEFYGDPQTIYYKNKPLVNVYYSYSNNSIGTVYFIPGFGGSPIETFVSETYKEALSKGFDVCVIEGIAFSATSGYPNKLKDMTLEGHRLAVAYGIREARKNNRLNHSYNHVVAHSLGARALCDISVKSSKKGVKSNRAFSEYFQEVTFINPYFLMKRKLKQAYQSNVWNKISEIGLVQTRVLNGKEYNFTSCARLFATPLKFVDAELSKYNVTQLCAEYGITEITRGKKLNIILGGKDDSSEFKTHHDFARKLSVKKTIKVISGANHAFENAQNEYKKEMNRVLKISKLHAIRCYKVKGPN
jgi:hypothetical protein